MAIDSSGVATSALASTLALNGSCWTPRSFTGLPLSGDLTAHFSRDFLLTTLTLYWATQTITSSMRDYFDNRWHGVRLGLADVVQVPTGMAVFAHHFADEGKPPRELAERLYPIRQWTVMPRGGHFAATEDPELLARDIAAFFAAL